MVLVTEYNRFEVLPGLHINGNLTLGENIADLGGVTIAYHAWENTQAPSADSTKDRGAAIGGRWRVATRRQAATPDTTTEAGPDATRRRLFDVAGCGTPGVRGRRPHARGGAVE